MSFIVNKFIPLIVNIGLALILLTPLPYGNVEIWSVSLFEIISFITFGTWIIGELLKGKVRIIPLPLYIPIGIFLILIIFQTVPLPVHLMEIISPHTAKLWQSKNESLKHIFGQDINLSYTISLYPFVTKQKLLLYSSYIVFFFVATHFIQSSKQIKRFIWIIFTVGIVESIIGLLQYILSGNKVPASGTYIDPDHFAGLLVLIIPLFLAYLFYLRSIKEETLNLLNKKYKLPISTDLLILFITSLVAISLILSQSRGAIFSFVISTILFYLLIARNKKSNSSKWILSLFFLIIIIYSLWIGLDPVIEKFSDTNEKLPERTYIWKDSIDLIKDFPLLGVGSGNFNLAYTLYKKKAYWPYVYDHAHNDYIELTAETGIIGFVLVIWALLSFYKMVFDKEKDFLPHVDPLRYYILLGCLCGMFGILIHAIVEFDFQIPSNVYYYIFLLSLSSSIIYMTNKRHRKN